MTPGAGAWYSANIDYVRKVDDEDTRLERCMAQLADARPDGSPQDGKRMTYSETKDIIVANIRGRGESGSDQQTQLTTIVETPEVVHLLVQLGKFTDTRPATTGFTLENRRYWFESGFFNHKAWTQKFGHCGGVSSLRIIASTVGVP